MNRMDKQEPALKTQPTKIQYSRLLYDRSQLTPMVIQSALSHMILWSVQTWHFVGFVSFLHKLMKNVTGKPSVSSV